MHASATPFFRNTPHVGGTLWIASQRSVVTHLQGGGRVEGRADMETLFLDLSQGPARSRV